MCGILGFVGNFGEATIRKVLHNSSYRGPDSQALEMFEQDCLALGHNRLAILDIEQGMQPLWDHTKRYCIVFNGEIFNAPELRVSLEAQGHHFLTDHSDTEVLLELYKSEGKAMLQKLNGMFAFAIYDRERKHLYGARDPFGIKPFYYYLSGQDLVFGSEVKNLLPFISSTEIENSALWHFFTLQYVPGAQSIVKGIKRLEPGHAWEYNLEEKEFTCFKYWSPFEEKAHDFTSYEALVESLREEFLLACKRWTLSDVPIACSLSGGLDSSGIVGALASQGFSNLKTYSLGFIGEDQKGIDETALARLVSEKWGTEHHEIRMHPEDLLNDLVSMIWHLDEPYGGGVPSWYVFKAMSKDVRVGLTGSGGDELFGNYGHAFRYENAGSNDRLGLSLKNLIGRENAGKLLQGARHYKGPLSRSIERILEVAKNPRGVLYPANDYYFSDVEKESIFTKEFSDCFSTNDYIDSYIEQEVGAQEVRNQIAHFDIGNQLAEEFLSMTDRFSMAFSLEARVPFLDQDFAKAVLSVSPALRMKHRDPKYLLKDILKPLLPKELLEQSKRGFILPLGAWIKGRLLPVVQCLTEPERLKKQGLFESDFYEKCVKPHLENKANNTRRIWPMITFQIWYDVYISGSSWIAPSHSLEDYR